MAIFSKSRLFPQPVRSALLGLQLRQQISFTLGGEASVELGGDLFKIPDHASLSANWDYGGATVCLLKTSG